MGLILGGVGGKGLTVESVRDFSQRLGGSLEGRIETVFGTLEGFVEFAKQLDHKRGVQIVYGGKAEFGNFLQSGVPIESIDDRGVGVGVGIPWELVWAVIPLGSYERSILG